MPTSAKSATVESNPVQANKTCFRKLGDSKACLEYFADQNWMSKSG
jgi:hypothetical protein